MRNVSFGECLNDELFQYAEDKADLSEIGNNTLVIMGEGTPAVGTEYTCEHFDSRKGKQEKSLSPTGDFANRGNSFSPPAKQKREKGPFEARESRIFSSPPPPPRHMEWDISTAKAKEVEEVRPRKVRGGKDHG